MLALDDEDKLLLIPGPTPVSRQILTALARPTIAHTSTELAEIFSRTLSELRRLMDLRDGKAFVFAGSGTLAQEAAIINFVETNDRLLVASNGFFGDRLTHIAGAHGLNVSTQQAHGGRSITSDELAARIQEVNATVVAFTHVDTATGVLTPLAEFCAVIREHSALSIVDGVAALGGIPEHMDEMGIDVVLSGSQKALGVPPGLAIVGAGRRALDKLENRTEPVPAFYADLRRWLPVMDSPQQYFSTHPVNLICALAAAMDIIRQEGLQQRYERHRKLAQTFRNGMLDLGFGLLTHQSYLASTLSVLTVPEGCISSGFRERLLSKGVVAATGLGDTEDRVVRFGHMGNISEAEIAVALEATRVALPG